MAVPLGASYLLDERIGQGATGEVWRGSRRSDGSPFAFKLLRPQLLTDQGVVGRFLQERGVLTGIEQHPNLVHVYDLVAEGQTFAIVMDLVDGMDLRRYLSERRTLPVSEALVLIGGVLAGVGRLHAAGIVHRDLKPDNTLLESVANNRVPRVTDYGTARLVAEAASTRTTSVIGTPEYLAPELADRGEVSAGADVYSAGVMLYELICGVTPFAGGLPVAVLRRHIDQEPGRPDHIDDRLWELLSRMLAKQPGQRPLALEAAANCQTLADVLHLVPALPKLSVPPPAPPPPLSPNDTVKVPLLPSEPVASPPNKAPLRLIVVAAAALVLVLVGGIALANRGDETAAQPAAASSSPVPEPSTPSSSVDSASPSATPTSPSASPAPTAVCTMTDFTTGTVEEARTYLSQYGITPDVTPVESETAEDGDVLSQTPGPGSPCTSPTLKVARSVTSTFLSDLEPVSEGDGGFKSGPAGMDDNQYTDSVTFGEEDGWEYDDYYVEYAIPDDAIRLAGRVGLSNGSASGQPIQVKILDQDKHVLFNKVVKVGDSKSLAKVKLSRDVRLRFVATVADDAEFAEALVVLANARIVG